MDEHTWPSRIPQDLSESEGSHQNQAEPSEPNLPAERPKEGKAWTHRQTEKMSLPKTAEDRGFHMPSPPHHLKALEKVSNSPCLIFVKSRFTKGPTYSRDRNTALNQIWGLCGYPPEEVQAGTRSIGIILELVRNANLGPNPRPQNQTPRVRPSKGHITGLPSDPDSYCSWASLTQHLLA